jgi:hypothetical protein
LSRPKYGVEAASGEGDGGTKEEKGTDGPNCGVLVAEVIAEWRTRLARRNVKKAMVAMLVMVFWFTRFGSVKVCSQAGHIEYDS